MFISLDSRFVGFENTGFLATLIGRPILHQMELLGRPISTIVYLFFVKWPLSDALLRTCYSQRGAVSSLHVHHELMVHICPCSLYIVHLCTFTSMQWDDDMPVK